MLLKEANQAITVFAVRKFVLPFLNVHVYVSRKQTDAKREPFKKAGKWFIIKVETYLHLR